MIGTPFVSKNEIDQRKVNRINKKPWEQEVRDEKGRKRFHGAFTGGFSAGYYNSVGSKEGWKPRNFQKDSKQNIMDFMDEEDITNQAGTHTITNKDSEFNSSNSNNMLIDNDTTRKVNLGLSILDKLDFIPKMNQIQQSLLLNSGYTKESCENSALINHKRQSFKFKDDYEGIGYAKGNELKYSNAKGESNNSQKAFDISNSNIMRMNAFEDNESLGFYNERDVSDYNFEEVDLNERNSKYNKNRHSDYIDHIPKYIKSKQNLHLGLDEAEFKMPQIPDDFDFNHSIATNRNKSNDEDNNHHSRQYFDMDKRKEALKIDIEPKHFSIKFESQAEILTKKTSSIIESRNQIENVFNFKLDIPFKDDINQISRFARFLAEKEGLKAIDNPALDKDEQMKFEQLYQTNLFIQSQTTQYLLKTQSDESNNMQHDEVIVTKTKWIPSHNLCKKCKIKDPYGKDIASSNDATSNSFNSIQIKCLKESNHHQSTHNHKLNESDMIQKENNEINTKLLIEAEPDINLFDSIFNNN